MKGNEIEIIIDGKVVKTVKMSDDNLDPIKANRKKNKKNTK